MHILNNLLILLLTYSLKNLWDIFLQLLFISILITANVEFILTPNKNYTPKNEYFLYTEINDIKLFSQIKWLFWIEINCEKKWMKIVYKENYCDEAV